jgi:hypothetical protein
VRQPRISQRRQRRTGRNQTHTATVLHQSEAVFTENKGAPTYQDRVPDDRRTNLRGVVSAETMAQLAEVVQSDAAWSTVSALTTPRRFVRRLAAPGENNATQESNARASGGSGAGGLVAPREAGQCCGCRAARRARDRDSLHPLAGTDAASGSLQTGVPWSQTPLSSAA